MRRCNFKSQTCWSYQKVIVYQRAKVKTKLLLVCYKPSVWHIQKDMKCARFLCIGNNFFELQRNISTCGKLIKKWLTLLITPSFQRQQIKKKDNKRKCSQIAIVDNNIICSSRWNNIWINYRDNTLHVECWWNNNINGIILQHLRKESDRNNNIKKLVV